ncbi:hypothetical protein FSP39_001452, partial [Pinctada imbricata]
YIQLWGRAFLENFQNSVGGPLRDDSASGSRDRGSDSEDDSDRPQPHGLRPQRLTPITRISVRTGGNRSRQNRAPPYLQGLLQVFVDRLTGEMGQPLNIFPIHGNPGDYAWGVGGLDNIITQLLNQLEGSGPPPAEKGKIEALPTVQITQTQVGKSHLPTVQITQTQVGKSHLPTVQIIQTQVGKSHLLTVQITQTQVCKSHLPLRKSHTQVGKSRLPTVQLTQTQVCKSHLPLRKSHTQVGKSRLPTVQLTQTQVDAVVQCSVCMEDFKLGEEAKKLPCEHHFHKDCIVPWLQMHGTCPVCRKDLNGQDSSLKNDDSLLSEIENISHPSRQDSDNDNSNPE